MNAHFHSRKNIHRTIFLYVVRKENHHLMENENFSPDLSGSEDDHRGFIYKMRKSFYFDPIRDRMLKPPSNGSSTNSDLNSSGLYKDLNPLPSILRKENFFRHFDPTEPRDNLKCLVNSLVYGLVSFYKSFYFFHPTLFPLRNCLLLIIGPGAPEAVLNMFGDENSSYNCLNLLTLTCPCCFSFSTLS